MEHQRSHFHAERTHGAALFAAVPAPEPGGPPARSSASRKPAGEHPTRRDAAVPVVHALQFRGLEQRLQVQILSLLKLAGPFSTSHWIANPEGTPDALVIGLGTEEGQAACRARRTGPGALPVLLVGSIEQARACLGPAPVPVLLLSPPFRHLSLYYCLDVLAQQCAGQRRGRAGAEGASVRLRSFPPASLLKADVRHVRLSAFLFAAPRSLQELVAATRCDPATVEHFLRACSQLGLLHTSDVPHGAPHAPRRTAEGSRRAPAPGVMAALRRWLGL